MLNQIVAVGRLVRELDVHETEEGKGVATLTLAIPRCYKNEQGEYDTDFIDFKIFDGVAKNTSEYCKKGDIIGIKGRMQSYEKENENGTEKELQLIAEKVTFLSSRSHDEQHKSDKEQGER